jgi:hypothetical protein
VEFGVNIFEMPTHGAGFQTATSIRINEWPMALESSSWDAWDSRMMRENFTHPGGFVWLWMLLSTVSGENSPWHRHC